MSTTHVFIVDSTTFKYHLEYMFVGTGAKDSIIDFNNLTDTKLSAQTENNLLGMIADINRVRIGDYVIFYLQQDLDKNILEGKFYGIFKIASGPFLDNLHYLEEILNLKNDYDFKYPKQSFKFKIKQKKVLLKTALTIKERRNILDRFDDIADKQKIESFISKFYQGNQYLLEKLEKSLTFRAKIEPYQVYSEGVTEWEALDDIQKIISPNQMLWSLIYRKLKGNRGCTPITLYESTRLLDLIRQKNNKEILDLTKFPKNCKLTFEKGKEQIKNIDNTALPTYTGRSEVLNVLPRLIKKDTEEKAYEYHLQAYIVSVLGKGINNSLDEVLLKNSGSLVWLGNEVSCGVGMQRMDILYTTKKDDQYFHYPVEIKSNYSSADNIRQLQRYVDWLKQYYTPNIPGDILPVLITYKIPDNKIGREQEYKFEENGDKSAFYSALIDLFNEFNKLNNLKIIFVEYYINKGGNIIFEKIDY